MLINAFWISVSTLTYMQGLVKTPLQSTLEVVGVAELACSMVRNNRTALFHALWS